MTQCSLLIPEGFLLLLLESAQQEVYGFWWLVQRGKQVLEITVEGD